MTWKPSRSHRRLFWVILLLAAVWYWLRPQDLVRSIFASRCITIDDREYALTHVTVIDGTGSAPRTDQTIIVRDGRLLAIGDSSGIQVPGNIKQLQFPASTVMPGLIGMHDHLFYETDTSIGEQIYSFPRLYLASGVTTIRTAGAVAPWTDWALSRL